MTVQGNLPSFLDQTTTGRFGSLVRIRPCGAKVSFEYNRDIFYTERMAIKAQNIAFFSSAISAKITRA